jgi:hypothetical protein
LGDLDPVPGFYPNRLARQEIHHRFDAIGIANRHELGTLSDHAFAFIDDTEHRTARRRPDVDGRRQAGP